MTKKSENNPNDYKVKPGQFLNRDGMVGSVLDANHHGPTKRPTEAMSARNIDNYQGDGLTPEQRKEKIKQRQAEVDAEMSSGFRG